MLKDKNILLGVTGGIAAYKSLDLVSRLKKAGAQVKVVMTEAATAFVTPLSFQTLSENVVYKDMFSPLSNMEVEHISLAKWADVIVIAPATANTIGKIAQGISDNMLTTIIAAARCPIILAPGMNTYMLDNRRTQKNMDLLEQEGFIILESASGRLACGDVGRGKMMEPQLILEHIDFVLSPKDLKGKKVLITAGPTQEKIDPVRYVSNHSSGKTGYSLAVEARNRGAQVILVTGPTALDLPWGIQVEKVTSTEDMFKAVERHFDESDILIKSAAPSDFKPAHYREEKIKKEGRDKMSLDLAPNPDIAKHFGQKKDHQFIVGFAAESHELKANAKKKLKNKNFDFIVANNITAPGTGFRHDTNQVSIYYANGDSEDLAMMTKTQVSREIISRIVERL
ncbi:MAG: bifunctional phosphopantothenoylcysteine decarboxylase/phosphopantothenate--cysteine ligase CoaBC [Tissierellia bacterium]|nr:bifunctional phosphopantothenoylcysteine decarboxylase/phosphopantothenate--cysteine ligase CoaBC [Tissierellia bacterium]